MQKDQVTIAVQASELKGPLGRPLVVATLASDRYPHQLVLLRNRTWGLAETGRIQLPEGPLSSRTVDYIMSVLNDEVYTALWNWIGVQAELEVLP